MRRKGARLAAATRGPDSGVRGEPPCITWTSTFPNAAEPARSGRRRRRGEGSANRTHARLRRLPREDSVRGVLEQRGKREARPLKLTLVVAARKTRW